MAKLVKDEPEHESMTFVLDLDIAETIKDKAREEDRTKSAVARRLIRKGLEFEEPPKVAKK